jgi:hypothetical protein
MRFLVRIVQTKKIINRVATFAGNEETMKWPWNEVKPQVIGREPIYPAAPEPTAVVVAEAVVEPKVSTPIPQSGLARKSVLSSMEMDEYARVCAEVGVDCCTDLTREKLMACLREENIHIFNLKQVVAYLDEKIGNDWDWRGLRSIDTAHMPDGTWTHTVGKREIRFAKEPYRGAVPLPVLLTVQKIQKALPDEVFFYVSAPKDNDGDPFLMVTNRWLPPYVIERWDEPNFRERTK